MQFDKLLRIILVYLAFFGLLALLGFLFQRIEAEWAKWLAEHILTVGIVVLAIAVIGLPPVLLLAEVLSRRRAVRQLFVMADRLNTASGEALPSESAWRPLVDRSDVSAIQHYAERVITYAADEENRLRRPFFELLCHLRGAAAARVQADYLRRFPSEPLAARIADVFISHADAQEVVSVVPDLIRSDSPRLTGAAAKSLLRRALVHNEWDRRFDPLLLELRDDLEQAVAHDELFSDRFRTWLAENG